MCYLRDFYFDLGFSTRTLYFILIPTVSVTGLYSYPHFHFSECPLLMFPDPNIPVGFGAKSYWQYKAISLNWIELVVLFEILFGFTLCKSESMVYRDEEMGCYRTRWSNYLVCSTLSTILQTNGTIPRFPIGRFYYRYIYER